MLAAANPHAIAITSAMPKLIDEDSRGELAMRLVHPQEALSLCTDVSPFCNAQGIAAARGLSFRRSIEPLIRALLAPIDRADVVTVESSLPAALLHQGERRVDRRRRDLDEAADFLDGGDECVDLQRSASFEILQH